MAIERGKSASTSQARRLAKQQQAVTHEAALRSTARNPQTPSSRSLAKPWTYTRRGYALAQSFRQLRKRKLASLSTLLVFGITLALPALILFTANSLAALGKKSVGEESVTAYLTLQTADLDGAALAHQLQSQPGIKNTRYVSRDEALALFNEQAQFNEAVELLGENPLPGAIIVYPDTTLLNQRAIEQLATQLEASSAIDRVQFDLRWVKRLQAVLNLSRTIGWVLAGFLMLTALLVIGNTIRLELVRRQSELEVSRLLGANRAFLHRPLLYAGALYGFLGGIFACIIALLALHWLRTPAAELSHLYASTFELILPTTSQLLLVVSAATLLGLIGAIVTLYQPRTQFLQNRRTGI